MAAKILIGADIVPTKSNYKYFKEGNIDILVGKELKELMEDADFTIFNLETPLTDTISPIEKAGPNLSAPTYTIKGLSRVNPCFFSLANNHILDQGEQGLNSTIKLLDKNKIRYAGAGKNLMEAQKPYITELNGKKIGIYCCAEHEFTIATEETAGANPFDPLESFDHVAELKKKCDYVIVLYHGGKEHYRYPSPQLQKVFRKLADKGADLVVAQHTHCIGCEEDWNGARLVYGQGNFLFDYSESEYWQTSLLISVAINESGMEIEYIPLRKKGEKVRQAIGEDAKDIIDGFICRTEGIKKSHFIERRYQEYADTMLESYLAAFSGKRSILSRIVNRLSRYQFHKWIVRQKYRKREKIALRNYIECEAHRELVLQGICNVHIE